MKTTNIHKTNKRKLKKTVLILLGAIIALVVLVIVFISPITKYVVEKYDEEYTGRQITMDWVYVNPFTGNLRFKNFKIYERKSDSIFLQAKNLTINIGILQIFSKKYIIKSVTLDKPIGIISQNTKKDLNFADLIERFSAKKSADTLKKAIEFHIYNMKIKEGELHYREKSIPINYFVKQFNFESEGMRWDVDTFNAKFSFVSGIGKGDINGNFTLNLKNKNYRLATVIHKFDLQILEQYLKDISSFGTFSANLDADIKAMGNLKEAEHVTTSGILAINDFHIGKNRDNDYASFDKLAVAINEVSPKQGKFLFDSVLLSHPYFKYERYDYLDNLQLMFGKEGSKILNAQANKNKYNLIIEIAEYVKVITKNFFQSYYQINRLAIMKANFAYNDFSLSERFSMNLSPLRISADSIDKNHKRAKIYFKSGIEPYGTAALTLSINPKDSSDFDINYDFSKVPASLFNPYTIAYTSFPLDRGTVELNGKWHVINGNIESENHLVVIDPRVSKRMKNKDMQWLPLPLIMAFVRERGNVIDYKIPITGNLKNPKFKIRDVILDLIKNIFIKPPTTRYGIKVKKVESEIEKLLTLKWEMRRSVPLRNEEEFIKKMADFLKKTPEAHLYIYPQQYADKEKEYILFYEAKKKYFLTRNGKSAQSYTDDDSTTVDKMSVKDSSFVRYLNTQTNGKMLFTVQDKCRSLVGSEIVNAKYKQLNKERVNVFMSEFRKKEVDNRVKIFDGKDVVPYNGFSFYKIEYKGELPKSLVKAYHKLDELNDESPRKKFKEERKKILGIF